MADNVSTTLGTFATDDVSSVHYQRVKLVTGADGTANDVSSASPVYVASNALIVTPSITVDTAVYAAGDTVGGKITLSNAVRVSGGASLLYSIHILDRSNQKPTGNILIFNADPSAATTTDNAAFVYSTDDLKQVARVPVTAVDYNTVNSKATADLSNLGRVVKAASGTSLYAVFVADGAPDFVAGTDLQIIFKFLPVD